MEATPISKPDTPEPVMKKSADVVVVGAGNAALCAALAARDTGASVLVLEAAPDTEAGGNSTYTAGAMRVVYNGLDDVRSLVPDLGASEIENTDFGQYGENDFFDDMFRVTEFRTDPDLCEILVRRSLPTLQWMREQGVRFQTSHGRQAHKVNGRYRFWGGLVCEVWGGGPGLVQMLTDAGKNKGIEILYETLATELIFSNGAVTGVKATKGRHALHISANAVVLACGGFESNAEMRARYLGRNWDLAKVRGTKFNMGLGHVMALAVGARPAGHWSGAHAVAWDQNAPEYGDLTVGDAFQKHSYPFGIVVNAQGRRFIDEGADFRNYTYAKYGREILTQPGQFAWQVFDGKISSMLRDEYRIREVTKVSADTLGELAERMEGVDAKGFLQTVETFNRSILSDRPFDPTVKDGRAAVGLDVPKSNWANAIDTPPFEAYAVTCGVTFTFGGLKITPKAEVEHMSGKPIPGLFAAGEIVGGLFYNNYPGGTGLTSGAVFGKIAGEAAADFVKASATIGQEAAPQSQPSTASV